MIYSNGFRSSLTFLFTKPDFYLEMNIKLLPLNLEHCLILLYDIAHKEKLLVNVNENKLEKKKTAMLTKMM